MKVLLVEPDYRRMTKSKEAAIRLANQNEEEPQRDDETLWYPPLGLMKLARFHKDRGDEIKFVRGCDASVFSEGDLLTAPNLWDRVYITTLFTFHFDRIVKTINFYKDAVGGTISKLFVGGVMASLMPEDVYEATGIFPLTGTVTSAKQIGIDSTEDIDALCPDESIIEPELYAINETYYAYTSRGCVNRCKWCGVPQIEPECIDHIDIKSLVRSLRKEYGDRPRLNLMDNNVMASPRFAEIVQDLLDLGYGCDGYTNADPKRKRVIDFNQGVDASFFTEERVRLLSQLTIKPLRVAFDNVKERKVYERALRLAWKHGFRDFSNYMLYNFRDTPKDLYERLNINIQLNAEQMAAESHRLSGYIYSYPMRYAPIGNNECRHGNRHRDYYRDHDSKDVDWLTSPKWTRRFVRSIEVMKGAAHGSISPTPSLASRAIGHSFEEFICNLYMPEELLRNRNKYERKVYEFEPTRPAGTGDVERFRSFMLRLLKQQDEDFYLFHDAVIQNRTTAIRDYMLKCKKASIRKWLHWYL